MQKGKDHNPTQKQWHLSSQFRVESEAGQPDPVERDAVLLPRVVHPP